MVFFEETTSSFKKRVFCGQIQNNENIIDPKTFLDKCVLVLLEKVGELIHKFRAPVKLNCHLACEYIVRKNGQSITTNIYHQSKMAPITLSDDFISWFDEYVRKPIKTHMSEFQERDSGKALNKIWYLQVNVNKFDPTNSGGSSYIDLPANIKARKAVVNVQNTDEKCLVWALLSAMYPADENSHRPSKYPQNYNEIFNLRGIHFPTPLCDIARFEKQNNLSINVYGLEYDSKKKSYIVVGPLHYTKCKNVRHFNLLFWNQEEHGHYAWIKSLSRLLSSQISKKSHKKFICDRCLQYFSDETILQCHEEDCTYFNAVKIEIPSEEEKWLKFKNFMHKERHPFVIYADFESLTLPINSCQPNPTDSYTNAYQYHVPCAVGYQVVCSYDESLSFYDSFRGPEASAWFINRLKSVVSMVEIFYKNIAQIEMTDKDWNDFNLANVCHICQKKITNNDMKVRDHCHLSGAYRGAAHNECNLNYKLPHYIPVFFHNLSGYDSHFFIRELGIDEKEIQIIPTNEEKYISFSKQVNGMKLRFLDSLRFMNSSLEKLVNYIDHNSFKLIQKYYPHDNERNLLLRKGVFPYDYLSSWECLEEKQLPPKETFFSKLKNQHISNEDYEHANRVWYTFNLKTLGEYMDIYLQTDVLLLADVFENFRDICLKSYQLDPAHYYTTPGLAWDAMMKVTNIELELFTDINMILFFERGIRGGISQCCNRYARANNKYMESYNSDELETFLMYFDACNLYGWAMTQCLPHSCFKWLTDEEVITIDIMTIPDNGLEGFIFEVDLEYPRHLHDAHKDFPLCPEQRTPPKSKLTKLMTTLYDKKKYILYYKNLKQALKLGLKLKKIYRGIKFKQSLWLKQYIDKNTELRKLAKNDFEKNFFKLMNNAVFGKSMENIRNRRDIKLVSKWDGIGGARKLIAKSNFKKVLCFSENLVSIELSKVKIKFNKPIYVGMIILDISKTLMYDFHYNYILKTYTKPKLLYMDTDSLIYQFYNEDPYTKIKDDIHRFDTSDYALYNRYGIPQVNKKVVGLFKDENAGFLMKEFAGLRAKMYSFILENEISYSKAKGISESVIKTLTISDYKNTLFNNTKIYRIQNNIISKKHNIFSIEQNKLTLSADDDKRYIQKGITDTLPWGHYNIEKEEIIVLD